MKTIRKTIGLIKIIGLPIFAKSQFSCFGSQKPVQKVPQIQEVKQEWNQFSDGYSKFDLGPQTFYYSFLALMNIAKAKNVLQVACGSGKLLPVAVMLKNPSTKYLAVDLAQNMIQKSKKNLQQNLSKYDSKLSLEQWCSRNSLSLKVANAQESIGNDREKFDRIICNLVLMLTENPQKMLKSLYDQAESGCLLGVTVWGDKDKNNLMGAMRSSIIEAGFDLPNQRSNFHLYRKVDKIAEKIGWKTVLKWQQNALFPLIQFDEQNYKELFNHQINKLPVNQREKVKEKLFQKINTIFQKKQGLNFSCELYLFRK